MDRKDPPTCANCLHFWNDSARCDHPAVLEFDPLCGRTATWARSARELNRACGPDGKLFMPIPPPTRSDKIRRAALVFVPLALLFAWMVWH